MHNWNQSIFRLVGLWLALALTISLLLPSLIHIKAGLYYTSDTGGYLVWINEFRELITNPLEKFTHEHFFRLTYAGHMIAVALSRLLLGPDLYGWGVVIWSWIVLATGIVLTARELAWRLPNLGGVFVWICTPYLAFSVNLHFHGRSVLSDVAFAGLVLITLGVFLSALRQGFDKILLPTLILIGGLTTFYRPTGLVLPVFFILVYYIIRLPKYLVRGRGALGLGVVMTIGWFFLVALFAFFSLNYGTGSMAPTGVVSDPGRFGGIDVVYPTPQTVMEVMQTVMLRFAYYFRIYVEYFSPSHNAFRFSYYLPVHLGILAGFAAVVGARATYSAAIGWWCLFLMVVGLATLQSCLWSIADFNRYYVHAEPTEILLSIFGWSLWVPPLERWMQRPP